MSKLTDYMDRWLENTPVIPAELDIPLYTKDPGLPDLKLRETGLPEKINSGEGFVEVPTFASLLERLEKLEAIVKEMKK